MSVAPFEHVLEHADNETLVRLAEEYKAQEAFYGQAALQEQQLRHFQQEHEKKKLDLQLSQPHMPQDHIFLQIVTAFCCFLHVYS